MKITLTLITFISIELFANENWIKMEPINQTQATMTNTRVDVNLSQIEPINKMMKNVTVVKQLIDATSKKEKQITNDKNWFSIKKEGSK